MIKIILKEKQDQASLLFPNFLDEIQCNFDFELIFQMIVLLTRKHRYLKYQCFREIFDSFYFHFVLIFSEWYLVAFWA